MFKMTEEEIKQRVEKAVDRAVGWIDDDRIYQLHLYYACQMAEIIGISRNEVIDKVKEKLSRDYPHFNE